MDHSSFSALLNQPPLDHERFSAHRELESLLKKTLRGDVRFDLGSRALYATDSSNYRQLPIGVILPRDAADVEAALAACRATGAAVLPRGAGTSLAGHQAVDAATVVADHAAEGTAGVSRGIWSVGEMVQLGSLAEAIKDDARLDARQLCSGIDGGELVHESREVEDNSHVGALAGKTGSRAARQDCGSGGAAGGQSGLDVSGVAGQNHADGKLTIVRGVGCVKGAGTEIETDIAAKGLFEKGFQLAMGGKAFMVQRRLVQKGGKR